MSVKENADQSKRPVRERTPTERGLQYQIEQRSHSIRRSVTSWHSSADKLNVALSDSDDPKVITPLRDQLIAIMGDIRKEYSVLKSLLGSENEDAPMHKSYQDLEKQHHKIMSSVSEVLLQIKCESSEVLSRARSRISRQSNQPSRKSNVSKRSDKQELTAKAEEIRIKLKYMERESKAKLEYDRIVALKALDITQATLSAHDDFNGEDQDDFTNTKLDLPIQSKDDIVRHYVTNCNNTNDPEETKPLVSMHSIHSSVPNSLTSMALPTSIIPETKVVNSTLNPLASSFVHTSPISTAIPNFGLNVAEPLNSTHAFIPTHETKLPDNTDNGFAAFAKVLVDQVSLNRLPPPEPSLFSGDPLQYSGWKAAFHTLIEQRNIPKTERIHYLKRYLTGTAKESVENYFLLSSENAYDEAKKLLDERFGDPFIIGNAFRDKLEKWPRIASRDNKSLLKFADFLRQCHAAMDSIGSLKILDDDRENKKLISKLPDWIVTRWSRIVHQFKEDHKRFPPFKYFVDFICKEAKIASDPVTSLQSLKSDDSRTTRYSDNKPSRKFEGRSFAAETKVSDPSKSKYNCLFCGKGHELDYCKDFLSKFMSERKEFARSKNLCFGCLRQGHVSRNCTRKKKCKKCSKNHPTCFHGDLGSKPNDIRKNDKITEARPSDGKGNQQKSGDHQTPQAGISNLSTSGAQNKNSMVLPVYLSHRDEPECERLVYAMLDTQSDMTFILDDTCKSLGLSGTSVTLMLSTMLAENKTVQSTKVKGLVVRGHNSQNRISLPDTFSRNIFPANRNHIPTPDIAKSWPHLSHIAQELLPIADCEIGLLIGYNCSRALMPREVIPPENHGPFGQRTDLGWGIIGIVDPNNSDIDDDTIGFSHRTLVCEVPTALAPNCDNSGFDNVAFAFRTNIKIINSADVSRMMELDFSENTALDDALSQEDKRFLKVVGNGIKFEN